MTVYVTMHGGYNYATGDVETFATYRQACEAWVDRYNSNGLRRIDGVFFPGWGEMADDDYAITTECDGLTRRQVLVIADGGEMPPMMGWTA